MGGPLNCCDSWGGTGKFFNYVSGWYGQTSSLQPNLYVCVIYVQFRWGVVLKQKTTMLCTADLKENVTLRLGVLRRWKADTPANFFNRIAKYH